ncbi:MAG: GGDEF domain-containing protein [Burkholderiaceae bacterium]|jgi:diguanylate cyclase|nr:GGDEF domain-containing protein [Burkholderiaceae bacterium]
MPGTLNVEWPTPAQLAKGALRRLAMAQLEPTPEHYARAYAEEAGTPVPTAPADPEAPAADPRAAGLAWVQLVERLARQLPRGGRQWTQARRRDSLQRVLDGSRSDALRLQQRLASLFTAWETDQAADPVASGLDDGGLPAAIAPPGLGGAPAAPAGDGGAWNAVVASLAGTLRLSLPAAEPDAAALAQRLAAAAEAIAADGATAAHVLQVSELCDEASELLGRGHRVVERLAALCHELTEGLAELTEDDGWVQGQCQRLRAAVAGDRSVRGLRAAQSLLAETRQRQRSMLGERRAAREALKRLMQDMLREVGDLGEHTGRFRAVTERHAEAIAAADSLPGLAHVVQAMLDDTRTMQGTVARSHEKLQADQARAGELEQRVRALEAELKRLSDEVSTDLLTQVANRRGLMQAFEAEVASCQRKATGGAEPRLAVGLIDIDNFKKLNDTLGHAAGDEALKSLAAAVRERLRPEDHLARFGGEEFVVLMPGTGVEEACQALTRLQRSLTEALFLHEGREVFVTFSGGVTAWRPGEALEPALERADRGLYEAKRTGKNRTCAA